MDWQAYALQLLEMAAEFVSTSSPNKISVPIAMISACINQGPGLPGKTGQKVRPRCTL
jgi:hypothetical protein